MASASAPRRPPSPNEQAVESASDAALTKLAPELRPLAQARSPQVVLATALVQVGTHWQPYLRNAVARRPLGNLQWVSGEIKAADLLKLAGLPGVFTVISLQSYAPALARGPEGRDVPGGKGYTPPPLNLEKGRAEQLRTALQELTQGLTAADLQRRLRSDAAFRAQVEELLGLRLPVPAERPAVLGTTGGPRLTTIRTRDIHGATLAWAKGYMGAGVVVAVVDTGVDFAHPDLQGTQARVPSGPYAGWPFAYDALSGYLYALNPALTLGPDTYWDMVGNTWYAHTLPVEEATCTMLTCTANLEIDTAYGVVLPFVWPNTSESGQYYYTVHPDLNLLWAGQMLGLGYAFSKGAPAAVIVADESVAGRYDSVYVDVDFDQDLTDEKPMRQGDELAGADLFDASGAPGSDGIWDLSAGMLAWIADGANPPPGTAVLFGSVSVPPAGRLLAFIGDDEGHGTNCAGDVAAQGVISDPDLLGPINPIFGGRGEAVLSGMAPGARVAAFQHGFWFPFDAWVLAALGFDGLPNSGDEAQISSNSWGASAVIPDGWDVTSRFAHWLVRNYAPTHSVLVANGNGGHGYGTVTSPDGGPIIDVGASTQYGTLLYFEPITDTAMLAYGDVQPWSDRGPTMLGDLAPDVVAVGAFGTGANPLNIYFGNGEAAYDYFGGTSMATPIAAGNLALTYQAFRKSYGRWPTWQEAKAIFLNAAQDLGYDVLTQGSGNVDANRATDIAAGEPSAYWIEPPQWNAGGYRGADYAAFPAVMHAGESDIQSFTVRNPSSSNVEVGLRASRLARAAEFTFTLSFAAGDPPPFQTPTWITDITSLLQTFRPDLVRAQVVFPYSVFDPDRDYDADTVWRAYFYGWKDLNGDNNLWTDTNGNGVVDAGEIDQSPWEYNRFTYADPAGTFLEVGLGRESIVRWLSPGPTGVGGDGIFFGLQRAWGTAATDLTVRLTFYRREPWDWVTLSATELTVPPGGTGTFSAQMQVPAGTRPGLYEGMIEVPSTSSYSIIPVLVHVAADSPNFAFGAANLEEPLGAHPYDNGHLLGGFDWWWRYESGDWKLFYYDVPSGSAGAGRAMVVDTQWVNPQPLPPALFFEDFEGSTFPPAGWQVVNNGGNCVWESTRTTGRPNYTGGSGHAADADADRCGFGTTMHTELRTPPIDLSGLSQAWLAFRSDFNDLGGRDDGYVEISTGGGSWTQLLHYDGADCRACAEVIDLTPYVGNTVQLRFRYVAPGWDWWWEVDEVGIYESEPNFEPPYTDVDTWLYAASADFFSTSDPAFFGPSSVALVGGSEDTNIGGGTFTFRTATNGPREVVAGALQDGLGFIALHNVLYAGTQVGEPIVGRAYTVQVSPSPATITSDRLISYPPHRFSDAWVETFTSAYTLTEGLRVSAYGLNQPSVWDDASLLPDPTTICDWYYGFSVLDGGLIAASTSSSNIPDIDLYLWYDDGWGWRQIASSAGPTADEFVRLRRPPDGWYGICVDNFSGTPGTFDLTLRAIQGSEVVVTGLPSGAIAANTPVTFTVAFTKTAAPGTVWEGVLFLGPAAAPYALEVPITVNLIAPQVVLEGSKTASTAWASTGEVFTYTLVVRNRGTREELVAVTDPLPPLVEFVPGSQQATKGTPTYNFVSRTLSWSGWLAGNEAVTITFRVRAQSGRGWAENVAYFSGALSQQTGAFSALTFINPRRVYLPLVLRP